MDVLSDLSTNGVSRLSIIHYPIPTVHSYVCDQVVFHRSKECR
jgi:hypothetical protein